MAYNIHVQISIERTGINESDEQVASLDRYYDRQSLDKIADCIAHFGKSTVVLLEGAELGVDGNNITDRVT
jgi:hypothetical protein